MEKAPIIRAPATFNSAHIMTAGFGLIALVVTAVAIALGPSVQPFTNTTPKSNMSATYAHGCALHNVKKSLIVIF